MVDWTLEQITDHVDQALARPTSLYVETLELEHLIRIDAERVQLLEDAIYSIQTLKWIDDATGAQLDNLGKIVGEQRLSRSDTDYREAIRQRIVFNQGSGEPETLINFLRILLGITDIRYSEGGRAGYMIFVGSEITADEVALLEPLTAAGVGHSFVMSSGADTPFGFKEEGAADPTDIDGLGDLTDPEAATGGGMFADLYEV